jgi:hypothetical protein
VITYIFQKKFGGNKSNMKYEKFSENAESEMNMDTSNVNEFFREEYLNCDLIPLSSESSGSCESLNGLDLEICDKGVNSCSVESINTDNHEEKDNRSDTEKEGEVPVKLVVTYHFSFETDENEDITKHLVEECVTPNLVDEQKDELSKNVDDDNEVFEDCSFYSDDEEDLLEYSSVKNGSKNNLLDDSYGPELCYSVKNVCLVDYNSDHASDNSADDSTPEIEGVKSDESKENIQNLQENRPQSMRKNFIYYSSAVKLYAGELRYEDDFPEKKFKFARKIFKKVFPSQKYVVNN